MKDEKKTIAFIVFIAAIMTVVTVATISFAYFSTVIEEGDIFTTTGKAKNDFFKISMTENQSGVTLENTYPMPDDKGLELDPYTFTVKNEESSRSLSISVILEVVSGSTLADNLVNVSIGNSIRTLDPTMNMGGSEDAYRSAYLIYIFNLDAGESMTHELRTWINSNGTINNAQNKTWSSRILVIPTLPLEPPEIVEPNPVNPD